MSSGSKKMKLISLDEYESLKKSQNNIVPINNTTYKNKQIPSDTTSFLDNKNIPDEFKVMMYSHVMKQAISKIDKYLNIPTLVKEISQATSDNIKIEKQEELLPKFQTVVKIERTSRDLTDYDRLLLNTLPN